MIVEWFVSVFSAIGAAIVGLFPEWEMPAEIANLPATIDELFATIDGFGAWAPFTYMGVLFTAILGVYGTCLLIKVILKAVSHSPVSGGSG